jgi:small-conductance mechanosensitive channel
MADEAQSGAALSNLSLGEQVNVVVSDTSAWLVNDSRDALIAVAAGAALYFFFITVRWALVKLLGGSGDVTTWRGFAGRMIRRTRSFFLASASAFTVVHAVSPPGPVVDTLDFLFTVSTTIQGAIWLREIILAFIERRAEANDNSADFASAIGIIRVLVNIGVWALATILVLDNLGVDVTTLIAGLGVGGIAIGLAAQGIFSDLFAALAILFDRPFRVGETIQFGANTGKVEAIGMKTVRVRLLSGEQLVVGNTQLLAQEVSNLKRIEERRVIMGLGVTYQTPPEKLEALPGQLRDLVNAIDMGRFDRAMFVGFGASSIDMELVFYIESPAFDDMVQVRHKIGVAIVRMFYEQGLDFAYPTQTTFTAAPDGQMIDPRLMMPPLSKED